MLGLGLELFLARRFSPAQLSGLAAWWDASNLGSMTPDDAVSLVAASSQQLSIGSAPANLSMSNGASSLCLAGWVNLSATGADRPFAAWGEDETGATFEYYLRYDQASGQIRWSVCCYQSPVSVGIAFPGTGQWVFVAAYYDHVAGQIGLSVNGSAYTTAAFTSGVSTSPGTPAVRFGSNPNQASAKFFDGRMDEWAVWNRALTVGEIGTLYAGGSGIEYGVWSGSLLSGLTSVWRLRAPSGTRSDSVGSNHLTAVNGPVSGPGIPGSTPSDGDPVTQWADLSGNARHASQATPSKKPILKTNVQNGLPGVLLDAVDDCFSVANAPTLTAATVIAVLNLKVSAANRYVFSGGNGCFSVGFNGGDALRLLKQNVSTVVTGTSGSPEGAASLCTAAYTYGSGNAVLRVNRVDQTGAVSDPASTFTAPSDVLGARASGAEPFGDYLHEVLVFNRVLSSSEIAVAEDYLRFKWGTP